MKKSTLKKSDVIREGYLKGLEEARRIISEQVNKEETKCSQPFELVQEVWQDMREKYDRYLRGSKSKTELGERLAKEFITAYTKRLSEELRDKEFKGIKDFFINDLTYWEDAGAVNELLPLLGHKL